ncbi:14661_t:CDS:1, partial [Dentiscutata heterogama]
EEQLVYFIGLSNEVSVNNKVFDTSPQRIHWEVEEILKPNSSATALYGIYPYNTIQFSSQDI